MNQYTLLLLAKQFNQYININIAILKPKHTPGTLSILNNQYSITGGNDEI
jgi:hypothetical protein